MASVVSPKELSIRGNGFWADARRERRAYPAVERATTPPPKRHAALRVALKLAWSSSNQPLSAAATRGRRTYREALSWHCRGNLLSIRCSREPGRTDLGACFRFRAAALSNSFFRNPIAKASDILSKTAIQMP